VTIPEPLLNADSEFIRYYIEQRLPIGHRLVNAETAKSPDTSHITEKNYYTSGWPRPEHIYLMYYGIYLVNQLKCKHEAVHGKYDLVIRTRPDLSIDRSLDLLNVKNFINDRNDIIVTPSNARHGNANDQFAIGSSIAMDQYADIVNNLDSIYDSGVEYGPEILLNHHLQRCNIMDHVGDFNVHLRESCHIENNVTVVDLGTWR
jgi:hypothetical protein